jgi:hypothetical protein
LNVSFRKARLAQSSCHGVGGARRVTCSRRGIDLDQFFIDVEGEFLTWRQCVGGLRREWRGNDQSGKGKPYEDVFGAVQPPRNCEHHVEPPERFA